MALSASPGRISVERCRCSSGSGSTAALGRVPSASTDRVEGKPGAFSHWNSQDHVITSSSLICVVLRPAHCAASVCRSETGALASRQNGAVNAGPITARFNLSAPATVSLFNHFPFCIG